MQTLTDLWAAAMKPFLVTNGNGLYLLIKEQAHGGLYLGLVMQANEIGYSATADHTMAVPGNVAQWELVVAQ